MSEETALKRLFQVDQRTLGVEWADGKVCHHDVRELRLACSCAVCVNEWTGERILEDSKVPADVHPMAMESVGLYGLKVEWSDGHSTGIYTYDRLRSLCKD